MQRNMKKKPTTQKFKNDKNRDAFNHWRDHAIAQMTAASTMMFGLASAGLAYTLSQLAPAKSALFKSNELLFDLFTWAFAVSFAAAVILVINRLESFRKTANVVRLRDEEGSTEDLATLRKGVRLMDHFTWALFYVQLLSFGFGGGAILILMWYLYTARG